MNFKQVSISKGNTTVPALIPEAFAEQGRKLEIKTRLGWVDEWEVMSVSGDPIHENIARSQHKHKCYADVRFQGSAE